MNWSDYTLDQIAEINAKNLGKDFGFDLIRYIDISSVGTGILEEIVEIPLEIAPSRARRVVRAGDTIISTVRPGRRSMFYFKTVDPNLIASTGFSVLSPIKRIVNERFLYYLVFQQSFTDYLTSNEQGAAYPAVSTNIIGKKEFRIPPLPYQLKIVSILSTYDDLIAHNLKRIKLLEVAVQMIYKEQFGDLLLSENCIDNFPTGYSTNLLGEIIEKLESGSRPKGGIDKKLKAGIPSIGAENVIGLGKYHYQAEKMIPEPFFAKMKNGVIEDRDILIYKDGAYIGKTSLFQDDFPYTKCCVNEHVFLVHCSNKLYQYFLFLTLNQSLYYKKMQNLNANAAQPGINQVAIKSLSLIWPDEKTVISFNKKIESMISLIFNLAKQNRLLQQARDLLLPKLMTGEIEV